MLPSWAAGASAWKEVEGALPRTRRSKPVLIPRGGEVKGWSWVELAGTEDKEFPSGTELVGRKGTEFQ